LFALIDGVYILDVSNGLILELLSIFTSVTSDLFDFGVNTQCFFLFPQNSVLVSSVVLSEFDLFLFCVSVWVGC